MALISRGIKSASGDTNFATGKGAILSAEVDTDINTIVTEVNGSLDNDNVDASADIALTKLADYGATHTETNPGISGSESAATTLAGEIERLRFAIRAAKLGNTATQYDGSTNTIVYYGDNSVRGRNLCRNGSFEAHSSGTPNAPDGWALVSTPASVTQVTTNVSNGSGKAIRVVSSAGAVVEGIKQTFAGLKASTRYAIIFRYAVATGTMRVVTTGGMSTGSFRNVDREFTGSSWQSGGVIVQTDTTPTDLVVQFVSKNDATTDDFSLDGVHVFETNIEPTFQPGYLCVKDSSTSTTTGLGVTMGAFPPDDQLTCAVTVPAPGYTIRVTAYGNATAPSVAGTTWVLGLDENGSDVAVGSVGTHSNQAACGSSLVYVNNSPTPGTTYTYKTEAAAANAATPNGTISGTAITLESRLIVELIPPG